MPKVEDLEIEMKKDDAFSSMLKVDKNRLTPNGVKKSKVNRMGSGSKRTFSELVDEVDGGSKKKSRSSIGGE